jgi:ADP-ribose pyrophosphatase YjhB (NUDIX family)
MQKIIIASGPVIVEDGKVLLDQHGDTEFWKFCGGRVNENEALLEACERRAKEEMGIDLEILDPEPFLVFAKKETPEGMVDVILVHFLAKRIGEVKPGEIIRKWDRLAISELEKENLAPNILPALNHFGFLK